MNTASSYLRFYRFELSYIVGLFTCKARCCIFCCGSFCDGFCFYSAFEGFVCGVLNFINQLHSYSSSTGDPAFLFYVAAFRE